MKLRTLVGIGVILLSTSAMAQDGPVINYPVTFPTGDGCNTTTCYAPDECFTTALTCFGEDDSWIRERLCASGQAKYCKTFDFSTDGLVGTLPLSPK